LLQPPVARDDVNQQAGDQRDTSPVRRPRLDDVAALVGVSTATVSLVLRSIAGPSAQTRQRVLDAAAELGYRPDRTASLLARRRRQLLGVMMDVHNTYHADLVEDIHDAAEDRGYDLVLSTLTRSRDERRAVETLLDFRCEALILLGPEVSSARLVELNRTIPVVCVGRRLSTPAVDVVRSADDIGVAQALEHLVQLGHRDIAFVDGGRGTIAADRRRGYTTAMRRQGLGDHVRVIPGDHTEAAGSAAAALLLELGTPPSAVMTSNDRAAVGFLAAMSRAGIPVPESVSLVGYDDSLSSRLAHVNLTTVSQDALAQAQHAVALAVERLDDERTTPREVVLTPALIIRGTTGSPPATAARMR
jgi:DNA-binding LacI/PurR family transcriptional regulator